MRLELFEGVADADLEACLRIFAALDARLGLSLRPLLQGIATSTP